MAERAIEVVIQIGGEDVVAGRLWSHRGRGTESMTFAYDEDYLARQGAYALDPVQLGLHAGQQQTPQGRAIFGAFSDTAPDRWGRRVIERRENKRAKRDGAAPRSFGEIDYLLGVRDDLRQGALRFREPGAGDFLDSRRIGVPTLVDLPTLLGAADKLERGRESEEDLTLLLRGGSSLGGARPKAHVLGDHGKIAIAKFPSPRDDDWDVMRWESVALQLAREAGITVTDGTLHEIDGKWVLAVDRFDRVGDQRLGYVSAMTMLGLDNGDRASYLDIADVISRESPKAREDLRELWRRMAFSVLISNTDDHLRNHGFLRTSSAGWTLSPAFDLNPNPRGDGHLNTAINFDDNEARIDLLMDVAEFFRLDRQASLDLLAEISRATARWQSLAADMGLDDEIDRMEPAFDHQAALDVRGLVAP